MFIHNKCTKQFRTTKSNNQKHKTHHQTTNRTPQQAQQTNSNIFKTNLMSKTNIKLEIYIYLRISNPKPTQQQKQTTPTNQRKITLNRKT